MLDSIVDFTEYLDETALDLNIVIQGLEEIGAYTGSLLDEATAEIEVLTEATDEEKAEKLAKKAAAKQSKDKLGAEMAEMKRLRDEISELRATGDVAGIVNKLSTVTNHLASFAKRVFTIYFASLSVQTVAAGTYIGAKHGQTGSVVKNIGKGISSAAQVMGRSHLDLVTTKAGIAVSGIIFLMLLLGTRLERTAMHDVDAANAKKLGGNIEALMTTLRTLAEKGEPKTQKKAKAALKKLEKSYAAVIESGERHKARLAS
jgi:hypothetical protein